MMRLIKLGAWVAAGVVAGGCGVAVCPEPEGWRVEGEAVPEGVTEALALVRAAAPCQVDPEAWGGTVTFQEYPFWYENGPVEGLSTDVDCHPRLRVATYHRTNAVERTALVHELGHVAFAHCGWPSYDPFRSCHPQDFLVWAWQVDAALAARLGHPAMPAYAAPAWACPEPPTAFTAR